LILGITGTNRIYAFLATRGSSIAASLVRANLNQQTTSGVFCKLPLPGVVDTKALLLARLGGISRAGWHRSHRLDRGGQIMEYRAPNGGGYTLEALLGIIPNGRSEPDFMGWELKAFSKDKITLMTPEPDGGYYERRGVEAFVRRYGHDAGNNTLYFTGVHKANVPNMKTGMTLLLDGFDAETRRIINPSGGIILDSSEGEVGARWSFSRLLEHWGRKHSQAAYVKYTRQKCAGTFVYRYLNPVWLGEGTDFSTFLQAMSQGIVYYDPAPKVMNCNGIHSRVKARSQFRIGFTRIRNLYRAFEACEI